MQSNRNLEWDRSRTGENEEQIKKSLIRSLMNPKRKRKTARTETTDQAGLWRTGQCQNNAPFRNTKLGICATGAFGIRGPTCEAHRKRVFVSHQCRATILAVVRSRLGNSRGISISAWCVWLTAKRLRNQHGTISGSLSLGPMPSMKYA